MLNSIICLDELWIEFYTPPGRHQAETGTSVDPLSRPELHEHKILLTVGIDIRGIAFWETFEENITMNGERYKFFLERHVIK